ncbi:Os01g0159800 [Oryza sativa Japonica Group]|uniref:Os01g0159800 protein n=1 Tax=Oryza sativa subsp. japonica TaxID=39947 RepID=A0A0P0UYC0_ORYSJ|nr:Os01g0159800 [Oryza sativa Japonica Group]
MAECQPLQLQEGKKLQELQPYDGCNPSVYRGPILLPRQANSAPPAVPPEMSSSSGSGRSATEARALKIHSEAERRRRERINAHLTTLRRMIPDTKQVCASFYRCEAFRKKKNMHQHLSHFREFARSSTLNFFCDLVS